MKSTLRTSFALVALVALSFIGFQNCSGSRAPNLDDMAGTASTPPCSGNSGPVRMVIMIQDSLSAQRDDPTKYYRSKVVQSLLSQYGNNSKILFSLGMFSVSPLIWDVSQQAFVANPQQPFGNSLDISAALNSFLALNEMPQPTYFVPTFYEIGNLINSKSIIGDGWQNQVIIISTGAAIDLGPPPQTTAIENLVTSTMSQINSSSTIFNAAYFGPESLGIRISNAKAIASAGGGIFLDTNLSLELTLPSIGENCST